MGLGLDGGSRLGCSGCARVHTCVYVCVWPITILLKPSVRAHWTPFESIRAHPSPLDAIRAHPSPSEPMGASCARRRTDDTAAQDNGADTNTDIADAIPTPLPTPRLTTMEIESSELSPCSPSHGHVPNWGESVKAAKARGVTQSCDLPDLPKS